MMCNNSVVKHLLYYFGNIQHEAFNKTTRMLPTLALIAYYICCYMKDSSVMFICAECQYTTWNVELQ